MEASQWKKLSNQLKPGSRQLLTWTENVVRPCSTEVMHDSHDEFAAGALCGFDVSYQLARGHSTVRGGLQTFGNLLTTPIPDNGPQGQKYGWSHCQSDRPGDLFARVGATTILIADV